MSKSIIMSEVSKEELQVETPNVVINQPNSQAPISPEIIQTRREELEYVVRSNPSYKEDPMYKQAVDELNQLEASLTGKKEEVKKPENNQKKEEGSEETGKKNPFKKKDKTPENIEDIPAYIKQKYSMDEPGKLFETFDKMRVDNEELTKVKSDYDTLLNDLNSVPDPIKAALSAFANGDDWEDALVKYSGRPDYNKKWEKEDSTKLVKYYFPEEYKSLLQKKDNGDFDDEDFKERVDLLRNATKLPFEKDKSGIDKQRAELMKKAEESEKIMKASITGSVDALKTEFDFSQSELNKVRQFLVNGDVNSLFYEKNGAYRKDAAKRVAYILYGDTIFEDAVEQAEKRGESKANEEIVSRGLKETPDSKAQVNLQKKSEEQAVAHLDFVNNKKKDYLHNPSLQTKN